ncbi:MAG: PLP-dependent aminotransferase family protein [Sporolactobacillus sp.]
MELLFPIFDRKQSVPLYMQFFQFLVGEIIATRIPKGSRLPSKRKLADLSGLSLNTVDTACQQLIAEGYIESVPRSGMYVIYQSQGLHYVLDSNKRKQMCEPQQTASAIDFSPGKVDSGNFPYALIKKYFRDLFSKEGSSFFQNGPYQGSVTLRQQIAVYLYESRGVICDYSQIIIGAGTQELVREIIEMLDPKLPFIIENPGFHRIRQLISHMKRSLICQPVEATGISLDFLTKLGEGIVYITPSHQFPLGTILSISKRMALINWANESDDRYIIEDDYDGEFRYAGRPIPALQGLDRGKRVIYMGGFSKSLVPSLRVSYAVLPAQLVAVYRQERSLMKQTASTLNQELIAHFMKNGDWQRHLNRMRVIYKRKRQVLVTTIKHLFADKVLLIGENSGLHLVLEIYNGMNEETLISSAKCNGVIVYPTSIYYAMTGQRPNAQVLLGYAGLTEEEIVTGVQTLHAAWFPGCSK